jgi:hypothetical protein
MVAPNIQQTTEKRIARENKIEGLFLRHHHSDCRGMNNLTCAGRVSPEAVRGRPPASTFLVVAAAHPHPLPVVVAAAAAIFLEVAVAAATFSELLPLQPLPPRRLLLPGAATWR